MVERRQVDVAFAPVDQLGESAGKKPGIFGRHRHRRACRRWRASNAERNFELPVLGERLCPGLRPALVEIEGDRDRLAPPWRYSRSAAIGACLAGGVSAAPTGCSTERRRENAGEHRERVDAGIRTPPIPGRPDPRPPPGMPDRGRPPSRRTRRGGWIGLCPIQRRAGLDAGRLAHECQVA